jgi:hypothetical protein
VGAYICHKTGKEKFTAQEAFARASWWRRTWMARMAAYKCKDCGSYHIGNDRRKPRRKRW